MISTNCNRVTGRRAFRPLTTLFQALGTGSYMRTSLIFGVSLLSVMWSVQSARAGCTPYIPPDAYKIQLVMPAQPVDGPTEAAFQVGVKLTMERCQHCNLKSIMLPIEFNPYLTEFLGFLPNTALSSKIKTTLYPSSEWYSGFAHVGFSFVTNAQCLSTRVPAEGLLLGNFKFRARSTPAIYGPISVAPLMRPNQFPPYFAAEVFTAVNPYFPPGNPNHCYSDTSLYAPASEVTLAGSGGLAAINPSVMGDINNNGILDQGDRAVIASFPFDAAYLYANVCHKWECNFLKIDFDGDGHITPTDLAIFDQAFAGAASSSSESSGGQSSSAASSSAASSSAPGWAKGDMNCNGAVSADDITPFTLALSNPAAYKRQYPFCDILNGDMNGDGMLSYLDVDAFVQLIQGGGSGSGVNSIVDPQSTPAPGGEITGQPAGTDSIKAIKKQIKKTKNRAAARKLKKLLAILQQRMA
jgi:hypothetical protein